jgi:RimJ/RimL family protein N-acetyltransferase
MIYGDRMRLRSPERSDLERFVRWINDPDVIQGLSLYRPMSMVEEEKWFENMLQRDPDEHPLVIEIRQSDQGWLPIGTLGLFGIEWRARSAELGIMIGEKSYWDQGYGSEAIRLLLNHAFEVLNLNRVFLRVFEFNGRAIRAYEKIGFVPEGRLRQAEYTSGRYFDVLILGILRSEWETGE